MKFAFKATSKGLIKTRGEETYVLYERNWDTRLLAYRCKFRISVIISYTWFLGKTQLYLTMKVSHVGIQKRIIIIYDCIYFLFYLINYSIHTTKVFYYIQKTLSIALYTSLPVIQNLVADKWLFGNYNSFNIHKLFFYLILPLYISITKLQATSIWVLTRTLLIIPLPWPWPIPYGIFLLDRWKVCQSHWYKLCFSSVCLCFNMASLKGHKILYLGHAQIGLL